MTDLADARLLAGPFDGDEGYLNTPLPDVLWVFACGNPPRVCSKGGIHWDRSPVNAISAPYERGPVDDGVQLYVYRDLRLQSHDKLRVETPAPPELEPA